MRLADLIIGFEIYGSKNIHMYSRTEGFALAYCAVAMINIASSVSGPDVVADWFTFKNMTFLDIADRAFQWTSQKVASWLAC